MVFAKVMGEKINRGADYGLEVPPKGHINKTKHLINGLIAAGLVQLHVSAYIDLDRIIITTICKLNTCTCVQYALCYHANNKIGGCSIHSVSLQSR